MTHVASVNNVPIVGQKPGPDYERVVRDLRRLPTTRAMPFQNGAGMIWIAKANCVIWNGSYYAKKFAIESAKQWAAAREKN